MDTVGAYRLLRQVGEGGMGVVHLALAPDGSRVAVKILRPQVIGDREARQRLEREVAAMRRIRSPRVAECLDAEPWGEPPYVVTRYVAGLSLTEYVAEYGPLGGHRLHRLALGTAEALAGVHAAGVLHRDIKPSNVLIDRDEPVLIDFGLAMSGDESRMTHAGWIFGTPAYLAPEIVLGDAPTPAADVHAWAATVVFAATGRSPYGSGPSVAVLDRIRRGEYSIGAVREPLAGLLRECLAPQSHERPTAVEVCHALAGATIAVPARRPPQRVGPGEPAGAGPTLTALAAPVTSSSAPVARAPATRAPVALSQRPVAGLPAGPAPVPGWPPAETRSTGARVLQWASGLALAATTAGAVAIAPYATTGLVVALLVLAGSVFSVGDRRRRLEQRRGPRGRDGFVGTVVWPVHALVALPTALLAGALALVAALAASSLQVLAVSGADAATVVGGAVYALVLAYGPAHAVVRRVGTVGTRLLLTPPAAGVVTVLVLATAALVLVVLAQGAPTAWWPFDRAPWRWAAGLL